MEPKFIRVYDYGNNIKVISTKEENVLLGVINKSVFVNYSDKITPEQRKEIEKVKEELINN